MHEILVKDGQRDCRIYLENTTDRLELAFKENKINLDKNLFILTDENVYNIYKEKIGKITNAKVFYFKGGEENKNINTVQKMYDFLIENGANRQSVLIALGGGIVGDLVGFVASTYMRGVKYINIPTTLLSQVDSCIGGKVGFDYHNIKNSIGSFYCPQFVYISINFLKTLDKVEILNGLGEIIKYSLISDKKFIDFLISNAKQLLNLEHDKLIYVIRECLLIKNKFISEDIFDLGIRNVLNFGHTIAHAIEVDSKYKIPHGVAVALGILVSVKISEKKLLLDELVYMKLEKLYTKLGLPLKYKIYNYKEFLYAINHDKKNAKGKIRMILISDIGKYKIKVSVSEKEIIDAVKLSIEN